MGLTPFRLPAESATVRRELLNDIIMAFRDLPFCENSKVSVYISIHDLKLGEYWVCEFEDRIQILKNIQFCRIELMFDFQSPWLDHVTLVYYNKFKLLYKLGLLWANKLQKNSAQTIQI